MSVELIISLASAIIVALSGVIVYQQKRIDSLQEARLADAIEGRKKSEAREEKVTDMASSLSQTTGAMYTKIAAAQQKSRGKL